MIVNNKKMAGLAVAFVLVTVLLGGLTLHVVNINAEVVATYNRLVEDYNSLVEQYNSLAQDKSSTGHIGQNSVVHCRIRIWKGTELILDEYHSGVVTDLGDNITLFKLFGDTDFQNNTIPYTDNCTYISIGNDGGTLGTTSTVLPGEWNRTAGTIDNEHQSYLNVSCTFYPDNAGPYTADCIGLNTNSTASAENLLMYDTFSEVTGIDETFTIFEPSQSLDLAQTC